MSLFCSTHPGTGVPIVLAGSKLTSDQVCKSFGKDPLPRKIEDTTVIKGEFDNVNKPFNIMNLLVYSFIITFIYFAFFPTHLTHHTPASYINSFLPAQFRVVHENEVVLERFN